MVFEAIYPIDHVESGQGASAGQWLDAVETLSEGRIRFERHWGGQPVAAKQMLRAAGSGELDLVLSYPLYYGTDVAIGDICAMPSNFRTRADLFDAWWGTSLGRIANDVYEKAANVKLLFPVLSGADLLQIGKGMEPMRTVADLRGRNVRTSGGMNRELLKALGANPIQLLTRDYLRGLQDGTVDAGVMSNGALRAYSLWDVVRQVVYPPISPMTFSALWMNLDSWNQLPSDLRQLLVDTERRMEPGFVAHLDAMEMSIVDEAKSRHGIEYCTLAESEQRALSSLTPAIWDTYVAANAAQGFGAEAAQIRDLLLQRYKESP